jgi:hypothetical protein
MLSWLKRKMMKIEPTTPGPSPWYLRAPWARINTPEGLWTWDFYDDPNLSGLSRLLSPHRETVLFVDFHCYIQPLPDSRLLVWYEIGRQEYDKDEIPKIEFTIIDLVALKPFRDDLEIAREIRSKKERFRFEGGTPRIYDFSTTVHEGVHRISPPPEFTGLPEVLVLADFGPKEAASNHWDKMCRAIFAFDFKAEQVTVLPQQWFNEGNYDFGYQWITRVQREPKSGQIVGEGIRLGNFKLDQSGTQIQEWLHQDVFYHPEQQ